MIRFVSYMIILLFTSVAVGPAFLYVAVAKAESPAMPSAIRFEDVHGNSVSLNDFKGKPIIINLWATWCQPCIEEMPSLAKLQQDYGAKGLVILALSEDDSLSLATHFYQKKNIAGITPYLDKDHKVWAALQTRGIPTSVFISSEGKVTARIEGAVDWQSPKVQALLSQIVK